MAIIRFGGEDQEYEREDSSLLLFIDATGRVINTVCVDDGGNQSFVDFDLAAALKQFPSAVRVAVVKASTVNIVPTAPPTRPPGNMLSGDRPKRKITLED